MPGGGIALKGLQWFLRVIEFCCAAIVISIFSYFLATLHNHHIAIDNYIKAVEGISGVAVVYTLTALLLLCCLAGIPFLSFFAILLDLAFAGAFAYVAWATRNSRGSCSGNVTTPFSSGSGSPGVTHLPSPHTACQLQKACFAVSIVAAVFFFLSIFIELALIRHHKKEKAFGPSPNNGYTAGSPRRKFWQRQPKQDPEFTAAEKRHPDALPVHATPADVRQSYATDATAVTTDQNYYNKYGNNESLAPPSSHHTGYYTPQTGYTPQTMSMVTAPSEMPAEDYSTTTHPHMHSNPTGAF